MIPSPPSTITTRSLERKSEEINKETVSYPITKTKQQSQPKG